MPETITVPLAPAFKPLLAPSLGTYRYRVAYGGRGSAKSWQYARALLLRTREQPLRILCTRELQSSIRDSVHKLLSDQVEALGFAPEFDVQQATIRHMNGSEFIFKGLRHNADEIKSTEGVDVCWVEEAEKVSDTSWRVLVPTIRKPGSEIWVTFNPAQEDDPTYQRLCVTKPPRSIVQKVSWRDNPWLPEVLKEEAEHLRRVDPDAYDHVWEGGFWTRSDAQIFAGKWRLQEFSPQKSWRGPYYGADWGFASDPTVLVRLWVADSRLWIEHAVGATQWETEDIPKLFDRVPGARDHMIRADSSRPETISALKLKGFRIDGAPKWSGSVEDGIRHLRQEYDEIVIHPVTAQLMEQEAKLYRYATDRVTGDVLPKIVDAHNHGWDAIRYALAPMIQNKGKPFAIVY